LTLFCHLWRQYRSVDQHAGGFAGLGEPALELGQIGLVARLELGCDQVVLALEMVVERALGETLLDRTTRSAKTCLLVDAPEARFPGTASILLASFGTADGSESQHRDHSLCE
jgi:hypothetical protein